MNLQGTEAKNDYELPRVLDEVDIHFFHTIYSSANCTLHQMCDSYVRHVGFRKYHILKLAREKIIALAGTSPFDKHWRLKPDFVAPYFGPYHAVYHDNVEAAASESIILTQSTNEYFDGAFPQNLRFCFARETRHSLKLYWAEHAELFCDVGMFQIYDRQGDRCWSTAIPFSLTKSVYSVSVKEIEGVVVFVGDIFGGTNFSHFLFDYVTRFGNLFESGGMSSPLLRNKNITFVFSGIPGDFHALVISQVSRVYGIAQNRIIFPSGPTIFRPSDYCCWFSDAYEHNQHPAQLMHEQSVSILKLVTSSITTTPATHRKIYVSREDATQRRVSNEEDVVSTLESRGFSKVVLGRLPLIDQIAAIQGAEIIVAPHGMGLTHCAFHQGQLKLIELFSPGSGTDAYAAMARAFKFDYHYIVGKTNGIGSDFEVDIQEIIDVL